MWILKGIRGSFHFKLSKYARVWLVYSPDLKLSKYARVGLVYSPDLKLSKYARVGLVYSADPKLSKYARVGLVKSADLKLSKYVLAELVNSADPNASADAPQATRNMRDKATVTILDMVGILSGVYICFSAQACSSR